MQYLTLLALFFGLLASPAMAQEPPPEEPVAAASCDETKQVECDVGVTAAVAACVVTEGELCVEALEVVALAGCCDCLPDGPVKEMCDSLKVVDGKVVDAEVVDAEGAEGAEEAPEEAAEEAKAPETDEEAVQTALSLVEALKGKQWPLAVGLLLTLLVYLVNRFGLKGAVSEKVIPWVAAGVGVAGAMGTGLVSGVPILESLTAGVLAGVAAVGGWEMVLKHLTPEAKKDKPADPPADPPATE